MNIFSVILPARTVPIAELAERFPNNFTRRFFAGVCPEAPICEVTASEQSLATHP